MMAHMMGLYDEPFALMKSGRKTVEVRLNDSKRQKLQVGDQINFIKAPVQDERLNVVITALKTYPTFRDLYEDIELKKLGKEQASLNKLINETYMIYSEEQENEFGVLAIDVERVE
ncbi:ASCH domain-containing protein [Alkalicoccobacillus plakortidis]|uniref:ASCH domain-containing protein n=1 Tax=Alkalicoccobacillus plakortidis TaxID=444060 RepID=A0ABT0XN15_9BACI|nr:ASCH domain-containing protein [Alkalicoccobacillus plakortidis]MCM2677212.1 ASCH domain-containing protein [Alkalicoccobacillus plakortidis]